jgi:DNA-binding NarL/FixJ family response regulator
MADKSRASKDDKITVLLVDDHSLVRRGFRRILDDEINISVVGEAGDGVQAIKLARELRPAVVLMDCSMPGMNGLTATKEILETCPETSVLMLSMHSETTWVRQAVDVGARGFILKNAVDLDLGSAIERVAAGELVFDPQLSNEAGDKSGRRDLSTRELEILQLIVDGKSNKEIAAQLNLSVNTVGVHRSRIMGVVGVRKTADLVVHAIRKRLVNIP